MRAAERRFWKALGAVITVTNVLGTIAIALLVLAVALSITLNWR